MWHDTLNSVNPNDIAKSSYLKVSDILVPPVQVSIQSRLLVEKFVEMASLDPSSLPAIKIGMTNQKMYAVNNLNVVQGCKKADPQMEIPVQINNYQDISDIIVQHVHETINEEPLNPLSIFDVIDILKQKGMMDKRQAIKMLWLNDTPYEKMFKLDESNLVSDESIEYLQKITSVLKERRILPSQIQIPLYIIIKLNRIESKMHQIILVEKIGIMLSCMTDSRFAWPTSEQIDTMYLYIKQDIQEENNDDDNYKNNKTIDKTKNKNNDNSKFPQYITDHLNPQNISQIRYRNFDSAEQLREFLDNLEHPGKNRFVLMWGEPAAA